MILVLLLAASQALADEDPPYVETPVEDSLVLGPAPVCPTVCAPGEFYDTENATCRAHGTGQSHSRGTMLAHDSTWGFSGLNLDIGYLVLPHPTLVTSSGRPVCLGSDIQATIDAAAGGTFAAGHAALVQVPDCDITLYDPLYMRSHVVLRGVGSVTGGPAPWTEIAAASSLAPLPSDGNQALVFGDGRSVDLVDTGVLDIAFDGTAPVSSSIAHLCTEPDGCDRHAIRYVGAGSNHIVHGIHAHHFARAGVNIGLNAGYYGTTSRPAVRLSGLTVSCSSFEDGGLDASGAWINDPYQGAGIVLSDSASEFVISGNLVSGSTGHNLNIHGINGSVAGNSLVEGGSGAKTPGAEHVLVEWNHIDDPKGLGGEDIGIWFDPSDDGRDSVDLDLWCNHFDGIEYRPLYSNSGLDVTVGPQRWGAVGTSMGNEIMLLLLDDTVYGWEVGCVSGTAAASGDVTCDAAPPLTYSPTPTPAPELVVRDNGAAVGWAATVFTETCP